MKAIVSGLGLFALLFIGISAKGQSSKAYQKAGDKAFGQNDFYTAFVHYRDAMALSPDEPGLWFKYAQATQRLNAYEEAERYYMKVVNSTDASKYPMSLFWLGQVKKNLGKYQEAYEVFGQYLQKGSDNSYYSERANDELNSCKMAIETSKAPNDPSIQIEHLDKKINTPFSEFGAYSAGKTLYYSSYRYDFPDDKQMPERKLSKVLTSENSAKGKLMGRDFNEEKKLTAHTTFTSDGQKLYYTICEYVNTSSIRCEIVYRQKDKRGNWEKKVVRLPDIINVKGFTATQPSIGFDSILQKDVLYFASDRPGGKGGLDIWYCALEKEKFLEPVNLSVVNTPENEISPFFDSRTQELFFSSDGRGGLGGYDVFAIGKTENWGEPRNLGMPVNSSYHDVYYSLDPGGKQGFVSSNRIGSFYLDPDNKFCCHDIYKLTYLEKPEQPEDPSKTPIPPIVMTPPSSPPVFEKLEDFLPLALYFDNDEPDKRTNKTTTKKSYEETYSKYFPRRQSFIEAYTKPIEGEDEADEAKLNLEAFFEDEVKKGYEHLGLFSEILLKRLEKGDSVEIVIKGYTSPRAKSDYNDALAQRRISSLRNHFLTWKGGIFESYLKHKKLVVSEAPFGEAKSAAGISDDLNDERNSIYSVGASLERRVEIIEIK